MTLLQALFDEIGVPPGGEQEYLREDLEPLLAIPDSWTQVLQEICRQSDDDDHQFMRICMTTALNQAIRVADNITWLIIAKSEFLPALVDFINSDYLFGFSSDYLLSEDVDELDASLIAASLALCTTYIDHTLAVHEPDDPEYMKMVDVVAQFPPVFTKLWAVRDPLLISEFAWETDPDSMHEPIHPYLDMISTVTVFLLQKHRNLTLDHTNSHIPHVLLLIWIYNPYYAGRTKALKRFASTMGDGPYDDFFRDFANGCTSHDEITEAMLREFRDEEILDGELAAVLIVETVRDKDRSSEPVAYYQEQVASRSLAATRRQICRGSQDSEQDIEIIHSTFGLLKQNKKTPYSVVTDRQTYGGLSILCHYCMLQIARASGGGPPDRMNSFVASWLARVGELDKDDDRPKTIAARRHALQAWRRVKDELRRRQLVHQDRHWKVFELVWERIGAAIPPVPSEAAPASPFELLQRCGWSECLCSVHKPAHRMRICTGCWLVAYCGPRCQEKDWEEGGHQECCRKRML
ncbi:zinc finger MYND domain-containing protein [Phanerochaete sordida]|uniref:Zinc finger MYND domain-containing protein n=1 Tax=Phanerochaete sordida TaxID=48140 RepID=A0A9P3GBX1_9APHY|nr:zinc finger MYND domain-containing protein [Phanerochaete sordida]